MTQSYNLSQLANNLNTAGQLDATDGLVGAVPAANGGTGIVSYTNGDILVANGATSFNKLSDVATGNALISGGVGAPPTYGKIDLTTHISGTLPVANGGTGITAAGTSGNALVSNGTAWASTTLPPDVASVNALVVSNNLSVALNAPWAGNFRSTTLSSGATTRVSISAGINLSVVSGATLGTVSGVAARIVLLAINNAGTVELAVVNIAGGNNLDETTLISTTAMSTAADSNNVIYSTTARTSVAFRVVGYVDITQATAGTWATAPSTVQGAGGNAVTAMSSLGYGQTWQNVSGSRAVGTTYYNTTGKPIQVNLRLASSIGQTWTLTVNGTTIQTYSSTSTDGTIFAIIPTSVSYVLTGGTIINIWNELC